MLREMALRYPAITGAIVTVCQSQRLAVLSKRGQPLFGCLNHLASFARLFAQEYFRQADGRFTTRVYRSQLAESCRTFRDRDWPPLHDLCLSRNPTNTGSTASSDVTTSKTVSPSAGTRRTRPHTASGGTIRRICSGRPKRPATGIISRKLSSESAESSNGERPYDNLDRYFELQGHRLPEKRRLPEEGAEASGEQLRVAKSTDVEQPNRIVMISETSEARPNSAISESASNIAAESSDKFSLTNGPTDAASSSTYMAGFDEASLLRFKSISCSIKRDSMEIAHLDEGLRDRQFFDFDIDKCRQPLFYFKTVLPSELRDLQYRLRSLSVSESRQWLEYVPKYYVPPADVKYVVERILQLERYQKVNDERIVAGRGCGRKAIDTYEFYARSSGNNGTEEPADELTVTTPEQSAERPVKKSRPASCSSCRSAKSFSSNKRINAQNIMMGRPRTEFTTFSRAQKQQKPSKSDSRVLSCTTVSIQLIERLNQFSVDSQRPHTEQQQQISYRSTKTTAQQLQSDANLNNLFPGKCFYSQRKRSLTSELPPASNRPRQKSLQQLSPPPLLANIESIERGPFRLRFYKDLNSQAV